MLCESEQARLCWGCDRNVHSANFLVAKHVRVLLCRHCHSPTPWKASGPSLTPTSSLCHRCVPNDHDHDHDDEEEEEEEEEESEEEEGENQVVPLSSPSASDSVPPLPTSTNSDYDGDMSSATGSAASRLPLKRFPDNSFIHESDEDEIGCSSSEGLAYDESSSMRIFRPFKQPRINQRENPLWHSQRW